MQRHVVIPEIVLIVGSVVRVIVDGASAETIEMVVTALEWSEFWKSAEMPFADERRPVAALFQYGGKCRMLRRQSDIAADRDRFFQANGQAVLVAAGDQRRPRGRANCRVRVSLQETHTVFRNAVYVGCRQIGTSVTCH